MTYVISWKNPRDKEFVAMVCGILGVGPYVSINGTTKVGKAEDWQVLLLQQYEAAGRLKLRCFV